jgi:hypothetical protein
MLQEVEVRQAIPNLAGEQGGPGSVLPHLASPGDLLLDNVDASTALSVLVQQPTYQVHRGYRHCSWLQAQGTATKGLHLNPGTARTEPLPQPQLNLRLAAAAS